MKPWKTWNASPLAHAMALALLTATAGSQSQQRPRFEPLDVFELEYASDPQLSPDGARIVYVRNFMDVMKDRRSSSLWIVDFDGSNHRPLTGDEGSPHSPRWSPDGSRLLYAASDGDTSQLYCRWMDTGQTAQITRLTRSPDGIAWSPDGEWIAFAMLVEEEAEPLATLPDKPAGAEWADPPKVIEKLRYRADGSGYLDDGYDQLFVVPAEGGTPRQLTTGSYDHEGPPAWTRDGQALIFSANRHADAEFDPLNSEIHSVSLRDGTITTLTDRQGPDRGPVVSPDGQQIAYLGFDDRYQGYQVTRLYVMRTDGTGRRPLLSDFDRSVDDPRWSPDSRGLFFRYDDRGNSKLGFAGPDGSVEILATDLGGTSIGRPYASGSYSVSDNGRFAFTQTRPDHPADVACGGSTGNGDSPNRLVTHLNRDLLGQRVLGAVEEVWFESSHDGRRIQGWFVKPPYFDPTQRHPMILEIHGGPFANYGDRFSAECQLYAAAGYIVLYVNPRGSTSYGEEFGNLIHHAYPGHDYDDLMSGVDALLARGFVDPDRLFVTGGSGGGVLTSWIVGKTDRFRAAVVAKPVINWTSFVLTSDAYNFFYKYWFPGFPWDHAEHYRARSPLFLVGNVTTPTMLLTGEEDYRTPMSETEQYYQALKLLKVDTALVRIPGASHGIAKRPSQLIAKVVHILEWIKRHTGTEEGDD